MSDWRVEENYYWGKMLDAVDAEENRIASFKHEEDAVEDTDKRAANSITWITATLPIPVAQEIKGRIENV